MKISKGLLPIFDGPSGSITFPEWSSAIRITLQAEQLGPTLSPWPALDRNLNVEAAATIRQERLKSEHEALAILFYALSPEQRSLIQLQPGVAPFTIWTRLTELYGAISEAQAQVLQVAYNNTKPTSKETV